MPQPKETITAINNEGIEETRSFIGWSNHPDTFSKIEHGEKLPISDGQIRYRFHNRHNNKMTPRQQCGLDALPRKAYKLAKPKKDLTGKISDDAPVQYKFARVALVPQEIGNG